MNEKVIFEVVFDDDDANKKMADLVKTSIELKTERQALEKAFKDGAISMQDYTDKLVKNAKTTEENSKAQKALKKDMDLATAGRKLAAGSVEQMKVRVSQLTAQYNALSKEERENTAEGKKLASTIKGLNEEIKDAAEATGKKGLAGAFKDAVAENTQFGKSIQTVGAAVKTNPIGLLATVLISLVGTLKESTQFMAFFEEQMAKINAIVDIAKDRFFTFASGLKEIFSGNIAKGVDILKQSTKGLVDEYNREVGSAAELLKNRKLLERQQIDAVATSQKLIAEEERLKTIRDDETKSIPERLAANEKANKLEEERRTLLLGLAQKNLDYLNQEAQRRGGLDKLTIEQYQNLKEAEAELDAIREDSEGRLVEFLTNRNSLNKEAGEIAVQLAKQRAEAEAAEEEKIRLGSIEALEAHEATLVELKTKAEETLTKAAAKGVEDRKKFSELQLKEQERIAAEEVRIQQAKVDAIAGISGTLSDVAGAFIKNARTAAGIQKGIALGQIATDTAVAISSLVRASNGNPLNLLTGGAAGVIQFTTGLATILTNIAKAKQLLTKETPAFAGSGIVPTGYEIAGGDGRGKGDNTLIWAKPGEVVLNAKHQAMLGGASTFRSIGVPGFADGGLVSRTVSAPVMQGLSATQLERAIASMPPPTLYLSELNKLSTQVQRTVAVSDH